ncbi:CHAT domain-containing protein [Actinoplanes sp. GCM10030250]|uniref:CHAT domain-containing protein n=1 Tax=Actinoplanes sp. GCM10030250 TaxID=3273376 RepID=UPI00361A693D
MPVAGDATDPAARVDELIAAFDRDGDETTLTEAEGLLRGVLAADRSRVDILISLSTVLLRRGRLADTPARFDAAGAAAQEAAAAAHPGDQWWSFTRAQLSLVASTRYEFERRAQDLSAAMRYATEAVSAVDPDDPELPDILVRCVNAYRLSFERSGRLADIDTAVRLGRLIGQSADPTHVLAAQQFLGACLALRFARTGDQADIDEAVRLCRDALTSVSRRHIDRVALNSTLTYALMQRWIRGDGGEQDLTEAIRISRELVAALPHGDTLRAQLLTNHASLLFIQALEGDSPPHLDEAVRRAREAVDSQSDSAFRAGHLANLANLLLVQARMGSDPAGVRAAVETGKAALAALSPGNPDRARALNILGSALRIRHLIDRDPDDLDAAVGMWRSAAGSRVGQIEIRMTAARSWARAAAESGEAGLALEAYSTAVGLLPLLAWRGLDRTVQEKRLAVNAGLAGDAAAWALAAGQPERAVELLEQGRQVLWSQAVQTRSDLSVLAAVAPTLAAELDEIRRELDGSEASAAVVIPAGAGDPRVWQIGNDLLASAVGGPARPDGEDAGRRRRLAERWEELLGEARRLPGLAGFLSPPSFAALRPATAGGAVVLVNTSEWRCDALVVTDSGVRAVPLPWLSSDAAQRRAAALLAAQREVERGGGSVARAALRQTLVSIQRWLWDTVAEPVCAALDEVAVPGAAPGAVPGPDGRHRVWWCPTGPLTMLPLHAAGRFGATAPLAERRRLSVAARCVSSYTPSLSALLRSRSGAVPPGAVPPGPPRAFAVGVATLPGQAPLPAVSEELRAVSSHVPGLRILAGRSATVEAVLTALEQHGWAHFACHGEQDFDRPSAGALRLSDGRLSVLDLAGRLATASRTRAATPHAGTPPGGAADLAYLSACRTAAGGRGLPDEAIHLTAALQMAGFRHVIGSQWAVSDRVAAQVAADVYAALTAGGSLNSSEAAYALDRAIDRVRRQQPDRPDLWAALIHTGP